MESSFYSLVPMDPYVQSLKLSSHSLYLICVDHRINFTLNTLLNNTALKSQIRESFTNKESTSVTRQLERNPA